MLRIIESPGRWGRLAVCALVTAIALAPVIASDPPACDAPGEPQAVVIGELEQVQVETPHPYAPGPGAVAWERKFVRIGATYIRIHFSEFNLAEGDWVEISAADGTQYHVMDFALITTLDNSDPIPCLELDPRLPPVGERIYISGHPRADVKKLTIESDQPNNPTGWCKVDHSPYPGNDETSDIGYFCDAVPGSSGSPVFSGDTHQVVAIHHAGRCPNRAVRMDRIYPQIETVLDRCDNGPAGVCGNGIKEPGEQCDGGDLGGATCEERDCDGGTPTCIDCRLNYSTCTACLHDNEWFDLGYAGVPAARSRHAAVWAGTEMLVWGGEDDTPYLFNSGGRYDPATDTWTPITTALAPSARRGHGATWLKEGFKPDEMVIWGGVESDGSRTATGKFYDPALDRWRPVPMDGAPSPRSNATVMGVGFGYLRDGVIVWGGTAGPPEGELNDGECLNRDQYEIEPYWYEPHRGQEPSPRYGYTEVWNHNRMIVWGGGCDASGRETGGRYHPWGGWILGWSPISTVDAPGCRRHHTAVWAQPFRSMIVWGGEHEGLPLDDGGRWSSFVDEDGDGILNGDDCDWLDDGAVGVVSEVTGLQIHGHYLDWDPQAGSTGSGTVYDVLRGGLDDLPVGSGAESCYASGVGRPAVRDGESPVPGEGFWYLVRGRNGCGTGSYGQNSEGGERTSGSCP